ncbi:unnamed protein product [Anisakis simplex]|uniref:Uncharacterized protein n=1 Tax=Anisakis simplex TaxID=6269 RepID=A0A0M3J697_ANISI|nr:unnamed protein product [Anisakis simplex]
MPSQNIFPQSRSRLSNRSEPLIRVRSRRCLPSFEPPPIRPNSAYLSVPSKIASLRCYQPPPVVKHKPEISADTSGKSRIDQLFPDSEATLHSNLPETLFPTLLNEQKHSNNHKKKSKSAESSKMHINAFKDAVLSEVILRGVYTDRSVILTKLPFFSVSTYQK